MKDVPPPPGQDRMTGVYCRPRCPCCRAAPGPDCADMATRKRRHVEKAQLDRYAATAWLEEQAAEDAENDITDCQHGCNGLCVVSGSDRCDFTCHDAETVAYFREHYGDGLAMCMMCGDAVMSCYQCSEERDPGNPRKLTRGWLIVFYLDTDTWCEHLTAQYGTDSPGHYAHFAWGMHDGAECDCVTADWFPGKPPPRVQNDD